MSLAWLFFIIFSAELFAAPKLQITDFQIEKSVSSDGVVVSFRVINAEGVMKVIYRPDVEVSFSDSLIKLDDLTPVEDFWIFVVDQQGKFIHIKVDLLKGELK
jgi:hypothetical protein